jgi:hypothetical protein
VNPDHLFIGTNDDNMADRQKKGRQAKLAGEMNPRAKLSVADVKMIRQSAESASGIARRYGMTASAISAVRTGRNWASLA